MNKILSKSCIYMMICATSLSYVEASTDTLDLRNRNPTIDELVNQFMVEAPAPAPMVDQNHPTIVAFRELIRIRTSELQLRERGIVTRLYANYVRPRQGIENRIFWHLEDVTYYDENPNELDILIRTLHRIDFARERIYWRNRISNTIRRNKSSLSASASSALACIGYVGARYVFRKKHKHDYTPEQLTSTTEQVPAKKNIVKLLGCSFNKTALSGFKSKKAVAATGLFFVMLSVILTLAIHV